MLENYATFTVDCEGFILMRFLLVEKYLVLTKRATLLHSFIHSPGKLHHTTSHPWRVLSRHLSGDMKRKATDLSIQSKAKRPREPEADYCDVIPQKDGYGNVIWPASEIAMDRAREFITEW